jgi:hypothetical protein
MTLVSVLIAVSAFIGVIGCHELGRRISLHRMREDPEGARAGAAAVESAVFALTGLLLAFTFSGAAARYEARRQLILQEANAISTAYARLDLLSPGRRAPIRQAFASYLDARLSAFRPGNDFATYEAEAARAAAMAPGIWEQTVAASRAEASPSTPVLLLPPLNQMFDLATARALAMRTHIPWTIIMVLLGLMLACGLFEGYMSVPGKTRNWMHIVGLATILAVTMFVTLDLEYPRAGLIRLHHADQLLSDLRRTMN